MFKKAFSYCLLGVILLAVLGSIISLGPAMDKYRPKYKIMQILTKECNTKVKDKLGKTKYVICPQCEVELYHLSQECNKTSSDKSDFIYHVKQNVVDAHLKDGIYVPKDSLNK